MTRNRSDADTGWGEPVDYADEFGYYEDAETEPVAQTMVWIRRLIRKALGRTR